MSGKKFDEGKLRMDLIPPEAIKGLAKVLTYGADKYGEKNWLNGLSYSRVYAAIQRHLWAFWEGEDNDDESGIIFSFNPRILSNAFLRRDSGSS